MKKTYLTAKQVEAEMQFAREGDGFMGKVETNTIKATVAMAEKNSRFGDKLLMVINPLYIHIPDWQRKLFLPSAMAIAANYSRYKWEVPKVLMLNNRLVCVDGMHRIYGAFLGAKESVTVEVITDLSEEEAVKLFLAQTERRPMSPADTYKAAVKAKRADYSKLQEIAHKYNIQIKGDDALDNPIGTLTSISDGVNVAKTDPELLDRIFRLLKNLGWAGATKANMVFSSKTIRPLRALYGYYAGNEDRVDQILLATCSGSEFYETKVAKAHQSAIYDLLLSKVTENIMVIPTNGWNAVTKAN